MAEREEPPREPAETRSNPQGGAREEHGGFKFGAAFFGWLVTLGLTALLSAIAGAIGLGAADPSQLASSPGTAGIVGAAVLLAILGLGYFAGGYVAGRMGRFNGFKQGLGVWIIALVVAILLALGGAVAGALSNVIQQLSLPPIPVDPGSLTIGAVVALGAFLLVTLGAALLGGKAGTRFHRKIDRAAVA